MISNLFYQERNILEKVKNLRILNYYVVNDIEERNIRKFSSNIQNTKYTIYLYIYITVYFMYILYLFLIVFIQYCLIRSTLYTV